jgi:hypothetical protein
MVYIRTTRTNSSTTADNARKWIQVTTRYFKPSNLDNTTDDLVILFELYYNKKVRVGKSAILWRALLGLPFLCDLYIWHV